MNGSSTAGTPTPGTGAPTSPSACRLTLLWPVRTVTGREPAVRAALDSIAERRLVAALRTAYAVPLGLRADLVLAVAGDRVMVHDDAGRALAGPSPREVAAGLAADAGCWVLEDAGTASAQRDAAASSDERGIGDSNERGTAGFLASHVLGGDDEALSRAIADMDLGLDSAPGSPASSGEVAAILPPVRGTVHHGEGDPATWRRAVRADEPPVTVFSDAALVPPGSAAASRVVDAGGGRVAALTVTDHGGWADLLYYSHPAMASPLEPGEHRTPTVRLTAGLGVTTFPPTVPEIDESVPAAQTLSDGLTTPEPVLTAESALTAELALTAESALAAELAPAAAPSAAALAQGLAATFAPAAADVEALVMATSPLRAQMIVAGLAFCAPEGPVAAGDLAQRPWIGELADAVEMFGFDPRWTRVLAGLTPTPAGGTIVEAAPTQPADPGTGPGSGSGPGEDRAGGEPAASGTGPGTRPGTRQPAGPEARRRAAVAYSSAIVAMLVAAFFLFLGPLPWRWADLAVAGVAVIVGVWQLLRAERSG